MEAEPSVETVASIILPESVKSAAAAVPSDLAHKVDHIESLLTTLLDTVKSERIRKDSDATEAGALKTIEGWSPAAKLVPDTLNAANQTEQEPTPCVEGTTKRGAQVDIEKMSHQSVSIERFERLATAIHSLEEEMAAMKVQQKIQSEQQAEQKQQQLRQEHGRSRSMEQNRTKEELKAPSMDARVSPRVIRFPSSIPPQSEAPIPILTTPLRARSAEPSSVNSRAPRESVPLSPTKSVWAASLDDYYKKAEILRKIASGGSQSQLQLHENSVSSIRTPKSSIQYRGIVPHPNLRGPRSPYTQPLTRPVGPAHGASHTALKTKRDKYDTTELPGNSINHSEPSTTRKPSVGDNDGLDVASVLSQLHAKVLQRTFKEAQLKLLRSRNPSEIS
jgi:hypothetical protein